MIDIEGPDVVLVVAQSGRIKHGRTGACEGWGCGSNASLPAPEGVTGAVSCAGDGRFSSSTRRESASRRLSSASVGAPPVRSLRQRASSSHSSDASHTAAISRGAPGRASAAAAALSTSAPSGHTPHCTMHKQLENYAWDACFTKNW